MIRSLLVLMLLFSGCSEHFEVHENMWGHWNHPPTIEICAETPIDRDHILDQFDWWYNEISDVYDYEEVIYSSCSEDIKNGTIRVEKFSSGKEYLGEKKAAAFTYYSHKSGSQHMNWAHIYLRGSNTDRTIRHEIGHAFGWNHFEDPDHLMYSGGGEETYDLEIYPPMK
jgi:hypothetical protein